MTSLVVFNNLKQKSKKRMANDKLELLKTGGGTYIRQVTHVDEMVLELLGHTAKPLVNPYDADASYNSETGYLTIRT